MKKTGLILIGLTIAMIYLTSVASALIKYSIIIEDTKVREDQCKTYYVLIDPVNLKNDEFKKGITELVKTLAKQKGRQITIDIFDDRNTLKKYYKNRFWKSATDMPPTETIKEMRHHIARFDDYIGMGTWLSFFPTLVSYNNDYNLFGKYYEFLTFNPYQ
jgi:hypothetical protein